MTARWSDQVKATLGDRAGANLDPRCQVIQAKTVCLVYCDKSPEPVFMKWKGVTKYPMGDFYVRQGPSTEHLPPESAKAYILTRFGSDALAASPLSSYEPLSGTAKATKAASRPKKKVEAADPALLFRRVEPKPEDRFKTCLPLVELEVAAGAFSDEQTLEHGVRAQAPEWVELLRAGKKGKPKPGMFVAQVRGRSMEPRIPDGAYGLFQSPVTGTRQGRVVLAALRGAADPEHGGRYTVKIYNSTKEGGDGDEWRHHQVILRPVNKEFESIELGPEDEVAVVAELVLVLS